MAPSPPSETSAEDVEELVITAFDNAVNAHLKTDSQTVKNLCNRVIDTLGKAADGGHPDAYCRVAQVCANMILLPDPEVLVEQAPETEEEIRTLYNCIALAVAACDS